MRILNRLTTTISFGPLNSSTQTRWSKRPSTTARTRLESRTRDPTLDTLTDHNNTLNLVLSLRHLITSRKRSSFISLNLLSRWAPHAGLHVPIGLFLKKYPHIFQVFLHPLKRNACCKFSSRFLGLMELEKGLISSEKIESLNVLKIKKILLMSVNGSVHLHSIRLMGSELGLPEDFRESIIRKYDGEFRLVDLEIVELVGSGEEGEGLRVAEVEKWRHKEYNEKWLGEFEVKYAFPMNFPTGFKKGPGFKERLRNWQRLQYVKPYEKPCEKMEVVKVRTCGGVERYEKRAVGIIHELLWLTVEKRMEVARLAHFRKDLGIMVNIRELLLKHPGIFYISIRGNHQMVFLREAYDKGCLIEPNPIYDVRRKMLDLVLLGARNTRNISSKEESKKEFKEEMSENIPRSTHGGPRVDDFVIQVLERDQSYGHNH
ncbi:hypothetical protein Leryth_016884 [Lithospermum erythrorhizon]|nr:hypothetical protein Leryth_016884 [Lithospermum erythrorhizon]